MLLNPWKRDRLAKLAECPSCQCEVAVEVMVAWRHAGEARERAGVVCECVRCGQRYTVLAQGGVLAYGRARGAVQPRPAAERQVPGGEGTDGGGSLFGDMVTNLDGRDL